MYKNTIDKCDKAIEFGNPRIKSHRDQSMDICKAIGIIAVVAGHAPFPGWIVSGIYLFHMPLFFVISGYFAKSRPEYRKYVKSTAFRLLVCAFGFLLFDFVVLYLASYYYADYSLQSSIVEDFLLAFFPGGCFAPTVFWFVQCLFIAICIFTILINKGALASKQAFKRTAVVIFVAAMIFQVIDIVLRHYIGEKSEYFLPWCANVVPMAMFYMLIGFWVKRRDISLGMNKRSFIAVISCFVLLIVLVMLRDCNIGHVGVNMKRGYQGVPFIEQFIVLIIFLCIYKLSVFLASLPGISSLFSYIGNASWTIMLIHMPVLFVIVPPIKAHLNYYGVGASTTFLAIAISLVIHFCLTKSGFTKKWFLGYK